MALIYTMALIIECVTVGLYAIFMSYFLKQTLDEESESKSPFSKHYAFFFLFAFTGELLYLYLMIVSPVEYRFLFWNDPDLTAIVLIRLSLLLKGIGYTAILYRLEPSIFKNSKHLLTIIFLIFNSTGQLFRIFVPETGMGFGSLIALIALGLTLFMPYGYFSIAVKSAGIIRKKALIVGVAFILIIINIVVMSPVFLETLGVADIIDINLIFISAAGMIIFATNTLFWGFK